MLNRDALVKNLGIATKVVGNKRVTYGDFITLFQDKGKLLYRAVGEGHELFLEVSEYTGDETKEVSVDYKKFGSVLKILNDGINLSLGTEGVELTDGSANAKLASYDTGGTAVDRAALQESLKEVWENGHKVNRLELLEALVYLHGLRGEGEEDELMQDMYFTKDYSFIFDERYVVRLNFRSPEQLVLDADTAGILIALLKASSEEYVYLYKRDNETVEFAVGQNYYKVSGLSNYVKDVSKTLNAFEPEEKVTVELSEFLRFIELATVFLEEDEEDIVCKMGDGEGRIFSDTNENSSEGTFTAEGVEDVTLGLNAFDVLTIIGGLKGTVSDELELSLNMEQELAYFKHDKGDCLLAVFNRN